MLFSIKSIIWKTLITIITIIAFAHSIGLNSKSETFNFLIHVMDIIT